MASKERKSNFNTLVITKAQSTWPNVTFSRNAYFVSFRKYKLSNKHIR